MSRVITLAPRKQEVDEATKLMLLDEIDELRQRVVDGTVTSFAWIEMGAHSAYDRAFSPEANNMEALGLIEMLKTQIVHEELNIEE